MRVLTDAEMGRVFGGDSYQAHTLDTITVTGYSGDWLNGSYGGGGGFGTHAQEVGYIPIVGACTGFNSPAYTFSSLSSGVPSEAKVRCLATLEAAVVGGVHYDLKPEIPLGIVNLNAFINSTGSLANGFVTRSCSSGPSGYPTPLYGLSTLNPNPGFHEQTTIFAGGMVAHADPIAVAGPNDHAAANWGGNFTASEWLVAVATHEAAHQHGVGNGGTGLDEARAWYYSKQAVLNYRVNHGNGCPTQ